MAIKTYQVSPYNDDFAVPDINFSNKTAEEKNFLRILFKPGVSVQVRELNQMQSILQNQIDKLGRGVFKEGPVPGLATVATVDRSIHYVDITINPALGSPTLATGLIPYLNLLDEIRLAYDGSASPPKFINAEILHYQALPETNRYRFFVKYLNSTQDTNGDNVQEFSVSDTIELTDTLVIEETQQTLYGSGQDIGIVEAHGSALHAKTEKGVYFVKGQFVYSGDQDIYAKVPATNYLVNAKLVFKVVETIVNFQSDNSLLDNAAGYPNETAPGADRYTIDLQLTILSQDLPAPSLDSEFIASSTSIVSNTSSVGNTLTLLEIDDSAVVQVARPEFSAVTDVLAERTREESGDYALEPYIIDIQGFYNDTEKDALCARGVYTTTQMNDLDIQIDEYDISEVVGTGDPAITLSGADDSDKIKYGKSRFSVGIEPSVAYVDGYRIAEPERVEVIAERARDYKSNQELFSNANLGSYFKGTAISGGAVSFDVDTTYDIDDATSSPGNKLATCRVRSLETSGGIFKLYVYDIQFDGGNTSLAGATTIHKTGGGFTFSIDTTSNSASGDANFGLFDTQYNKSIYKLPADYIKSVSNTDIEFTARKVFAAIPSDANTITLTVSGSDRFEEFGPSSYIIIDAAGVYHEPDTASRGNSGASTNNQLTLTTSSSMDTGGNASVVASYRSELSRKTKTSNTVTETISSEITSSTGFIDLNNYDVYEIVSATATQSDGNSPPADVNISDFSSSDLELDTGQRDGCYKISRVKYTGSATLTNLVVTYKYFAHGEAGDYFSVDSYGVDYPEIPNYKELRLSDSIDFRAKQGDGSPGDHGTHLDPNSTIDTKVDYYLSRIDKLVVTKDSEFKLIKGIPDVQPTAPSVPSTAMHLYTLFIPAYTFCHTNITTDFVDNRRYTMRDIGSIETRVQNLEYYTSLSLLEKEAEGKQIFDTANNNPYNRFKNGILVDSFAGHLIGYVDDKHYNCSMDPDLQLLRPYFESRSIPFTNSGEVTNVVVNDGLATLQYTEGPEFISQLQAGVSISVNPYDVATWLGSVKLSPSSDEWLETRRAPDIINNVGGNLNEMQAEVDRVNKLGTQWNSWQTTWTGKPRTTRTSEFRPQGWGKISPGRRGFAPDGSGRFKDTTWRETQSRQTREGVKTTASIKTVTHVKDDRVISVSFVPFIRARKVYFKGQLFKPNTKLKLFFDGVDITKYSTGVVAADYKEWSDNATVRVYHGARHTTSNLVSDGIGGDIITDDSGEVYGWFLIPNNSEHQFKTGERKVVLSDGLSASDPKSTTSAEAAYSAVGRMQTKQRTVVNTRTVVRRTEKVSQSRLQTSKVAIRTVYHDPLAQSFVIGENPNGLYIHSIDLYFSTVPTKDIPLKMYLVEVENGYPTQRVVPLSEVVKQKSEINETKSSNASTPTKFTFDSPIFLQFGIEYAIVTESNSAQYRQWLSEVGTEDVTTGEFISKNPYLGVSFKSQNASTWTADQMKDFKMELRRAEYASQGSIVLDSVGISSAVSDTSDGPLEYSQLLLNTDFIDHAETDLLFEISTNGGVDYNIIIPNENYYISTVPGTPVITDGDIKIKVTLSTNDTKITPVVDLDRISLLAIKNVINGESTIQTDASDSTTDTELAATHGVADAVYMTKEVILNNPSDRLDTYLNISRPYSNSNVRVYARFKRSEDNIEDIAFERIDPVTPIPLDYFNDFSEVQFSRDTTQDSTVPTLFNSFQVKIVLASDDHALVPVVKDFRAIATI